MSAAADTAPGMPSLGRLMDLGGRVVLVTGGAGHVGRAAAETFAELGARVLLLDRDAAAAERAAGEIAARFGVQAGALVHDLEREGTPRAAVDEITSLAGRLDVLVHCAALVGTSDLPGWATGFDEQSVATWRRALEVNLTAPFALTQAAAPLLRRSPAAAVVNVSSIYGRVGPDAALYRGLEMANPAAYAASKGGLEQLTRWLATTLAPEVRVNAIACGGIERGQPAAFRRRYAARTPLARMAREEDLKGAFAYLGSDLSRYVTGHVLVVDGGWVAW